jgi:hypothetical protein
MSIKENGKMGLAEINSMRSEFNKKIREEGEIAIKEEFKSIFESFPRLKAFRWVQYTPHFNDGEPCEFSVHDPLFAVSGLQKEGGPEWDHAEDEDEDEEGDITLQFSDKWSFSYYGDKSPGAFNLPTEEEQAQMKHISSILNDNEDIMQYVFDDGVQITVYRDGRVDVNEYDHD